MQQDPFCERSNMTRRATGRALDSSKLETASYNIAQECCMSRIVDRGCDTGGELRAVSCAISAPDLLCPHR
jgi:hypothetical protein